MDWEQQHTQNLSRPGQHYTKVYTLQHALCPVKLNHLNKIDIKTGFIMKIFFFFGFSMKFFPLTRVSCLVHDEFIWNWKRLSKCIHALTVILLTSSEYMHYLYIILMPIKFTIIYISYCLPEKETSLKRHKKSYWRKRQMGRKKYNLYESSFVVCIKTHHIEENNEFVLLIFMVNFNVFSATYFEV